MSIIASLEEWDSILNYYRPNGSSQNWYLNELHKLSLPLMWGEYNVFSEKGEKFSDQEIRNLITPPYFQEYIKFVPIEQINGINHLYIISIYTPEFFKKNHTIGFSCMSEKYKQDVREHRCKIVMTLMYEGHSGMETNEDLEVIEFWRIKEKFPPYSVYFITGNLIGDRRAKEKGLKITVLPISVFETWNKIDPTVKYSIPFLPIDEKYLFLSYNRQPRFQRIYLVHEYIKNDLFKNGLISLNKPPVSKDGDKLKLIPEIEEKIYNTTPFKIDNKELKYNLACNLEMMDYERTFISIISETLVEDGTLFLSEKIWKPLIVGHPFMVYGSYGTLEYLKSLGFKTFDKWIDESYDTKKKYTDRAAIIIKELLKFQKYSKTELAQIRMDMFATCEFNRQHFQEYLTSNFVNGVSNTLSKHMYSIWSSFEHDPSKLLKRLI